MEAWLRKLWEASKSAKVRFILLFLIVFLSLLGLIALASGIGFREEITQNRVPTLIITAFLALLLAIVWALYQRYRELVGSREKVDNLQREVNDLRQQNDSLLRLMEQYKAQAQESIINQLKRLAIFGLMKEQWQRKGAKVEHFRIDESPGESIESDVTSLERIAVLINLGSQDRVIEGMSFIVQDSTDSEKYGEILVKRINANGAACKIVETAHPAFWSEVIEALKEKRARIVVAPPNTIVPTSPLKEIDPDGARQLLVWLQNIERAEL